MSPSGQALQSVEIHGADGTLNIHLFAQKDRPGQLLPPGIYGWIEKRTISHGPNIGIHGVESVTVGALRTVMDVDKGTWTLEDEEKPWILRTSSCQTISVATADGVMDIYIHGNDVKLPHGTYGVGEEKKEEKSNEYVTLSIIKIDPEDMT